MNYLIIAYKPNSDDYCRGCHMASYSSDFEFINTNDREKALRFLTDKIKYDCDTGEAGYDFTIFIDGKTSDINDNSGNTDEDLHSYELYEEDPARILKNEAMALAQQEKENAAELRKQQEAREKAAAEAKAARDKEERDRKDYERLKAKFEGVSQ